ncbi:MAG: hypothetical protein WCS37_11575 [Chloroflexota bacterium]|nr:hypothetical protein [Chloroflexota bacterium]
MVQTMTILLHTTESENFEIFSVDQTGNRTLLAVLHFSNLKIAREIADLIVKNHHLVGFTED